MLTQRRPLVAALPAAALPIILYSPSASCALPVAPHGAAFPSEMRRRSDRGCWGTLFSANRNNTRGLKAMK